MHRRAAFALLLLALGCGNDRALTVPGVGPAPLRRLSNTEYLYALNDLFPGLHPVLPPLPTDNSVSGFENEVNAQAPSDVRVARFEAIAHLYAAAATQDATAVAAVTGCPGWATPTQAAACATDFLQTTGARIFRRPLTVEEEAHFTQRFTSWATAVDFSAAVQLTLSAMLQAPQFLYRAEPADVLASTTEPVLPVDGYAMASRLSFFLWESIPDDELLRAAGAGQLETEDDIRQQAARMLSDPRALRLAWDFHRQWLALDRIMNDEHEVRTSEVDAAWTSTTQASALRESRMFVERSFTDVGTLGDLLTSRRAWVNNEMARVYGVDGPATADSWREVTLPAEQRAGILTRAAFLAGYSHRGGTSPPIRGNAINLRLLCQLPAPPPDGVDLSIPMPDPNSGPQTNRMLFEARTTGSCQQCHHSLNGFGFGFESYTASGAFITAQQGLAIDPSGEVNGTDVDGTFANAIELSTLLGRSKVVHRCAAQKWIEYALGRTPTSDEAAIVEEIGSRFIDSRGDLRTLLTEIVASQTFRLRKRPTP
ncbi:MAG: DUF1592 domain-containing protein [Deltaproteobacteria bacterium]|nr:DUF1592 domain-containing protein [Deltaproteobacteria bacterium]